MRLGRRKWLMCLPVFGRQMSGTVKRVTCLKIIEGVRHGRTSCCHAIQVGSACLKTIFLAHLVYEYFYCIQPTIGASMLPTIQVWGDHVLISRSYRLGRGIQVGDVVSFASVVKPRERVIKRVIGMPGDWVLRDTPPGTLGSQMIQVPDGHCWVVGDNIEYSRDSRHYGPVPLALIYGKVIAKVFPWVERRWIENGLMPRQ